MCRGSRPGRMRHGPECLALGRRDIHQTAGSVGVEGFQRSTGILVDFVQRLFRTRIAHNQRGGRIANEIGDLGRRIGVVEWQEDGARAHGGEIERQRLGRLLHLHCNPIPRLHAQRAKRVGQTARQHDHVAVADLTAVGTADQHLVRVFRAAQKGIVEHVGGTVRHAMSLLSVSVFLVFLSAAGSSARTGRAAFTSRREA